MFILNFIIPIVIAYLFYIPLFIKVGIKALKNINMHICAGVSLLVCCAVQMILYMDFAAVLSISPLKILSAILVSVFFCIIVHGAIWLYKSKSFLAALLTFFCVAFVLELTVFNFRFYQTKYYDEIDITDQVSFSGYTQDKDNPENVYTLGESRSSIRIYNIDEKIHNLYFDIIGRNEYGYVENLYLTVSFTDESNAETFLTTPEHTVMADVESTKYLNMLTNGKTSDLFISLTTDYADTVEINKVSINTSQPFDFSIIRLIVVFVLLLIFWVLRPSSNLWSFAYRKNSANQKTITVAVIVIEIALLIGVSLLNPAFYGNPAYHTQQYQQLAESFMDGQLYLEKEPPEYLAELENPYDYGARNEARDRAQESYYWDAAYYNGRYYVYFGVVPVLLLYLPFYAVTGNALPNIAAINFFMVFFVIGSFLLIAKIIESYYKNKRIPYLAYLIFSLIFVNASCGIFIAKRPDFYSVPILSAIAFTVWGLWFWLSSLKDDKVMPIYAAAGSLCMALVAGCRPQLLLVSAMAVVIFWNSVFKDRSLFSKKGIVSTFSICIPYVLVAIGIMWYNNARFGSPFDFGANYNLTTNDMTGRGYRVERVGLSLFTYLFQLPYFTARFPFLRSVNIGTGYYGLTITEPMFGGIFAVIPLLWFVFLVPKYFNYLKKDKVMWLACLPIALAVFIAAFDAQGAGLLQRYVNDFSFLAVLGAIVIAFTVISSNRFGINYGVKSFLRFSLFASGAYCAMIIFAKYSVEIYYKNPYLYNRVAELVEFW